MHLTPPHDQATTKTTRSIVERGDSSSHGLVIIMGGNQQLGSTAMIGEIPAKLEIRGTQTTHPMPGMLEEWAETHIKRNIRIICHNTPNNRIIPSHKINTDLSHPWIAMAQRIISGMNQKRRVIIPLPQPPQMDTPKQISAAITLYEIPTIARL